MFPQMLEVCIRGFLSSLLVNYVDIFYICHYYLRPLSWCSKSGRRRFSLQIRGAMVCFAGSIAMANNSAFYSHKKVSKSEQLPETASVFLLELKAKNLMVSKAWCSCVALFRWVKYILAKIGARAKIVPCANANRYIRMKALDGKNAVPMQNHQPLPVG